MAHWIDKKQKTRVSDTDYNILSLGKKKTIDNNDIIMNINDLFCNT